jgi:hypothetical protein
MKKINETNERIYNLKWDPWVLFWIYKSTELLQEIQAAFLGLSFLLCKMRGLKMSSEVPSGFNMLYGSP